MRQMDITKEQIKELLLERNLFRSVMDSLADDTELVLDSLTLVWFLNGLESRYGLNLQLDDGDWEQFGSINAIHQLLHRKSKEAEGAESH